MSKELTSLEAFNNIKCNCNQNYPDFEKNQRIVETALKENQDIQSCFEYYGLSIKDIRRVCVSYKQREKNEKALEIIKEKKWLLEDILNAFIEDKSKYSLLKEVLL